MAGKEPEDEHGENAGNPDGGLSHDQGQKFPRLHHQPPHRESLKRRPDDVRSFLDDSQGEDGRDVFMSRSAAESPDAGDAGILSRSGSYPVSLAFAASLLVIYGVTTYPSGFRHIMASIAEAGVLIPSLVLSGEWWRLVTANLLHANPGHLFNNAFGIIVFGSLLEPQIGPMRLIALYALSALSGMGMSVLLLPDSPTLGASAIDYGLMAAYFTRILTYYYKANRQAFAGQLRSTLFFVAIFVGWNTLELSTVNLWAHLGGFAAGILFGLIPVSSREQGAR